MRKAHPKDLAAIARLSHQTLFLGREGPKVFPSETLWGALFVAPYLEAGCCNLVAEEEGRVVGYILGACADRPLALAFAKRLLWALPRLLRYPGPKAPKDRYPAHLHIAVDPEAQGHGVGKALLAAFLKCLREKGVPGVQLATTRANRAARGLYRAMGFRVYAKRASPFWAPYLGRPLIHEVWVRDLG